MKIGELAQRCDVSKDTIRHYLAQGLLHATRAAENGYQLFDQQAVAHLQFIKTARQLGFRLDDIKAILADAASAQSPCPRVRSLIEERIAQTRKTIAELTLMCNRMESSLEQWQTMANGAPNGNSICPLIESQTPVPTRT